MCGITGFYSKNNPQFVSKDELDKMTSCLVHRGPIEEAVIIPIWSVLGINDSAFLIYPMMQISLWNRTP